MESIPENLNPRVVKDFERSMGAGLVDKDAQGKRHNYMRVQRRVLQLRRDGRMPYRWITDGSRKVYMHASYDGPEDFADAAAHIYRKDYWMDSPVRVEVWVEKDAMAGKLVPVVRDEFGLGLYVSRGCASETYLQEAAAHIRSDDRPTYIYLLTDFDASGINIAETVERELVMQSRPAVVRVERLAAKPEPALSWWIWNASRTASVRPRRNSGSVSRQSIPTCSAPSSTCSLRQ